MKWNNTKPLKAISFTFRTTYAWMDARLPAFIKGLGKENSLPGKFYQLADMYGGVIYLTNMQHDYLVKHHFLDFGR